jgi:hypothetical protein
LKRAAPQTLEDAPSEDAPARPPADRRRAYRAARSGLALIGVPPQHAAIELMAFARGVTVREADLVGADAILARRATGA